MTALRRFFAAFILSFTVSMTPSFAAPVTKKIIVESPADKVVYRVVYATSGDAAWYEINRVDSATKRTEILAQDQQLFTNKQNDGGTSVPAENKHTLALGYADALIKAAGGVDAYTKSFESYAKYGVPLPTGLFRQALTEKGVTVPSGTK
jgi:hypothetical protein